MSQNGNKIDPGVGYRLLSEDEPIREGDEIASIWFEHNKKWLPLECESEWGKPYPGSIIRRRVSVVEKVDPGYGWRLLRRDEKIIKGDEQTFSTGKFWSQLARFFEGHQAGEYWTPIRRRIEAPVGYRLVGENEKIVNGDYGVGIFPKSEWFNPSSLDLIGDRCLSFTGKELNKIYPNWVAVRKLVKSKNTNKNTYLLDHGTIIQAEDEQYLTREKMWVKVYPHNIGQKVPGKGAFRRVKVNKDKSTIIKDGNVDVHVQIEGNKVTAWRQTNTEGFVCRTECIDIPLKELREFLLIDKLQGEIHESMKKIQIEFGKDIFKATEPFYAGDGWNNGPQPPKKPDLSKYPKWRLVKWEETFKPGDDHVDRLGINKRPITPVTLEKVPGRVFRQLEPHEILSKDTDWVTYPPGRVDRVTELHGEKADTMAFRPLKFYREISPGDLAD